MAKSRGLETRLARVNAIGREDAAPEHLPELRKFLEDKSNFVVAEAAEIVGERRLTVLAPDLAAAFKRFLEDGANVDPICKAKFATLNALHIMDYDEEDVFLAGLRCVQFEPAWEKPVDTAPPVRGVAAFALVRQRHRGIVLLLADLLADAEKVARCHAAQALGALASEAAIALLRFKAKQGDVEPEVVTDCLKGLIAADPDGSLEFVAKFLHSSEEVAEGAALAIADVRKPESFEILKSFFPLARGDSLPCVVLLAIAITRQAGAIEFLLEIVGDSSDARALEALSALAIHKHNPTMRERIAPLVAARKGTTVQTAFKKTFGN